MPANSTFEEIRDAMEPGAAAATVDMLTTVGMAAMASVSVAISLKRIADAISGDSPLPSVFRNDLLHLAWECGQNFKQGDGR